MEMKENTVDVPKAGEKLEVNKVVAFKNSRMIVSEVERVEGNGGGSDALKMSIRYENDDTDKIMFNARFNRVNTL